MNIHESAEDYLEAILIINKQKGFVRSIDVADYLSFSKASVSVAMKSFRENGYVNTDSGGKLTLTDKGKKIAVRIYERHRIIAKALMALGVDEGVAYKDSCKIEHDISDISFEKLKQHLQKHSIV